MPSLRHSSAMLSSPRRPAITMRIFSSAEYCRRVARRISRTRFSASSESVSTFDLIARSFAVNMSSKSSLPQSPHSVQLVLTGNTIGGATTDRSVQALSQAQPIRVPVSPRISPVWRCSWPATNRSGSRERQCWSMAASWHARRHSAAFRPWNGAARPDLLAHRSSCADAWAPPFDTRHGTKQGD